MHRGKNEDSILEGMIGMKVKDRYVLGIIAGLTGNTVKMAMDEIALRLKLSQRSFRSTAAGVWVDKKKQADSPLGQVLGGLLDFGLASIGGIATVHILTKTGRDHLLIKGLTSGIAIGSVTTSLLSALPTNKVSPKDAASNLSYMLSHVAYGLVTTGMAAYLGHPSIYDTEPQNDYLPPSVPTTEEVIQAKESSGLQPVHRRSWVREEKPWHTQQHRPGQ